MKIVCAILIGILIDEIIRCIIEIIKTYSSDEEEKLDYYGRFK